MKVKGLHYRSMFIKITSKIFKTFFFFFNDYSLKKSYVLHTPCSSSLSSCSGTLGELEACLRHGMLSSGITYSSTSLSGRPLAVPCRAVDGIASSKIAPLSVVSYSRSKTHKTFLVLILQWP